jgi:nucleoside-diphosphate-sugar epimerase
VARTVALVDAQHPAARELALALEDEPLVGRILGVCGGDVPLLGPKFEQVRAQPGQEAFTAALGQADALVLFPLVPVGARDEDGARRRVLDAVRASLAAAARAGTVVLWSSGAVYGAHPDNPVPLPEDAVPRPDPAFPPADLLAEIERQVTPVPGGVVVRGAGVWAPAWNTFLGRALRAPVLLGVRGFDPPVQALHPADAAAALALAARGGLDGGVYHAAPDDWVPASEVARLAGRRRVVLPERALLAGSARLGRLGVVALSPGELRYHMYPWVLANGRLRAAGWTPAHSTGAALAAAGREVAAGGPPAGPAAARNGLYRGAAVAGAAALATFALARRRARRT